MVDVEDSILPRHCGPGTAPSRWAAIAAREQGGKEVKKERMRAMARDTTRSMGWVGGLALAIGSWRMRMRIPRKSAAPETRGLARQACGDDDRRGRKAPLSRSVGRVSERCPGRDRGRGRRASGAAAVADK